MASKLMTAAFLSSLLAATLALGGTVLAKPPNDLTDLVGAKAAGAEHEMGVRGYRLDHTKHGRQYWWNDATRTCVKVTVSNGRYDTIDTGDRHDCGGSSHATTGPGAGCPPDVTEANRHLYPDCDNPSGGSASGDVPQRALKACMASADKYQNVTRGTSVVNGATMSGGNWVLEMASGTYKSTCTVTPGGKVIDMNPG